MSQRSGMSWWQRFLCFGLGWHEWRYGRNGVRIGSHPEAQHMQRIGYTISCARCGEQP